LIGQKDRRISVEMAKPDGRRRVIPDFRDKAEAEAWIIQTKRMIRVAHPYPPGTANPRLIWINAGSVVRR
jgi:hypothetical protein